jgi:hypothetical protein
MTVTGTVGSRGVEEASRLLACKTMSGYAEPAGCCGWSF